MLILTKSYVMGSIFRINVFIIYATRTIFIGNTDFGGPDSVRTYYKIFLIFHINLATIGGVLGLVQLLPHLKINLNGIEESDLSLQLYGSLLVLQVWQYTYYYM